MLNHNYRHNWTNLEVFFGFSFVWGIFVLFYFVFTENWQLTSSVNEFHYLIQLLSISHGLILNCALLLLKLPTNTVQQLQQFHSTTVLTRFHWALWKVRRQPIRQSTLTGLRSDRHIPLCLLWKKDRCRHGEQSATQCRHGLCWVSQGQTECVQVLFLMCSESPLDLFVLLPLNF